MPSDLGPAHAGERQQVVDELAHLLTRVGDGLQVVRRLVRQLTVGGPLQHLDVAVDVPQRRAQIVRHGIAEGFQFLVDDGQFRGVRGVALTLDLVLPHRVLEAFQLGHVPRRGEHALQTPAAVVEGGRVVRHHGFPAVDGARGELVVRDLPSASTRLMPASARPASVK